MQPPNGHDATAAAAVAAAAAARDTRLSMSPMGGTGAVHGGDYVRDPARPEAAAAGGAGPPPLPPPPPAVGSVVANGGTGVVAAAAASRGLPVVVRSPTADALSPSGGASRTSAGRRSVDVRSLSRDMPPAEGEDGPHRRRAQIGRAHV